jgi:hypothetical protein
VPDFADKAPELFEPSGAFGDPDEVPPIVPASFLIFLLGYILLGIAVMRAKVLPRWNGGALIVGSVVFLPVLAWPIPLFGSLIFGASLGWMGYALWSGPAGETPLAPAAT